PVLSMRGEILVPVDLLESLPRDSTLSRLFYDTRRGVVVVVPAGGTVGTPRVAAGESETRITFPLEGVTDGSIANRSRQHFRVRLDGYFTGLLPDPLPPDGLVRALRSIPAVAGSAFEMEVSAEAEAYRVVREPRAGRIVIELAKHPGSGLEAF